MFERSASCDAHTTPLGDRIPMARLWRGHRCRRFAPQVGRLVAGWPRPPGLAAALLHHHAHYTQRLSDRQTALAAPRPSNTVRSRWRAGRFEPCSAMDDGMSANSVGVALALGIRPSASLHRLMFNTGVGKTSAMVTNGRHRHFFALATPVTCSTTDSPVTKSPQGAFKRTAT